MSADTERDCLLVQGPPGCGKTTFIRSFLGAFLRPIVVCDSTGEWSDLKTAWTARDLTDHLQAALKGGELPDAVIRITGISEIEQTFRLVRMGEVPCTLVVDEVDQYLPNSGAANEDLEWCCRRGRHVQGPDYPSGVSVIAGVHAGQNCARALTRAASHVVFKQTEPNAVGRCSKYLPEQVDPTSLAEYEYVCSRGVGTLSFDPTGGHGVGPYAFRLDLDSRSIEKTRSFDA